MFITQITVELAGLFASGSVTGRGSADGTGPAATPCSQYLMSFQSLGLSAALIMQSSAVQSNLLP